MPIAGTVSFTGNFQLKLDGVETGFLKSVDGGAISAEVINEPADSSNLVKKHLGPPRYEPFSIQIGLWMGTPCRVDPGRVDDERRAEERIDRRLRLQHGGQERARVLRRLDHRGDDSRDGRRVEGPVLHDGEVRAGNGSDEQSVRQGDVPPVAATKEMWLASNFRLEIAGLDCSKVSAIGSFSVRQTAVTDTIGDARIPLKQPGRLEFPNLSITLAESAAATWMDWFDDFVVKGNNGDEREKSGSLIFLSPNLQAELGRVNFFNLGIFKIGSAKTDAVDERIQRVTAELYCERMELQLAKGGKV